MYKIQTVLSLLDDAEKARQKLRLIEMIISNLRFRGASKYDIEAELKFRKKHYNMCESEKCFGYTTEELYNALKYWESF